MSWFWSSKGEDSEEKSIQGITDGVLDTYLGETWRMRGFKHLTFRSEVFNLKSLDGLLKQPIDLTFLESLDVTENSLRDLDCIAGTSKPLKRLGMPQGLLIFGNLQVLKAKKNQLTSFTLKLPALRELDLSYNLLEAIPQMDGLPKLEVLLLDHNRINGSLMEVRTARSLKKLDLSNNEFLYSAVHLDQQLENLGDFHSLALKLKDNPFCSTIPSYQILCLQKLPLLRKLDDIALSDMDAQREAAMKMPLNLRALDDLAEHYEGVKVNEESQSTSKAMLAVFRPANKLTVFQEIAEYFAKALQDPSSTTVCIAGLTRLTHTISQCLPVDMENLRKELSKGKNAPERIRLLLADIKALALRVSGENEKILIFRAVAKMSVINEHRMGDECMKLLRNLTELHPQAEDKVIAMLQELIIQPLQHEYAANPDPKKPRVFSYLRILALFDSPRFGLALKPITQELTDIFCKLTKEVSAGREDTSYAHATILMERWSSSVENLKEEPKVGYAEILQTMLQILELETANLNINSNSETKEDPDEAVAALKMACNMLTSNHHPVVKVFLSWWPGRPSFWMRIMQKIMLMFGHNKKSESSPSLRALSYATERILTRLFDVMGAVMALPDQSDLIQEIMEGHDYRGQLLKYLCAVLEDEERSKPLALAGALRLAHTILVAYVNREDAVGEQITSQVIAALHDMRYVMDCLSMHGPAFSKLWQGLHPGEAEPKAQQLNEPIVLEIFQAMVKLVTFFSQQERSLYGDVRRVVGQNREELMFQLITVPHAGLKDAALQCLSSARVADTSCSEMESLLGLLDVKQEDLQSSLTYLERIMNQLNKMLTAQSGNGAMALRTTHAKMALDAVLKILVRTAQLNPEPDFYRVRVRMLQACLTFLKDSGRTLQDWRQHHLRSKNTVAALKAALQWEDRLDLDVPDISVERTWTGRSVETLLQCCSGLERLRPRHKVAFRLICRMADVIEGRSDFLQTEEDEEKDLHQQLKESELKPWDEEKMRKGLAYLDNMEEEDRRVQQEIFTSASGAQRLEMFLGGLYQSHAKNQARVFEAALIQQGIKLIEESKLSAAEVDDDDLESNSSSSSSDGDAPAAEAAVINMPARGFSGAPGDVTAYEDLRQSFMNKFQTAFSILFTARWDSFNYWSSVVDFGNGPGQENIVIANQGRLNSLVFEVYRRGQRYTVTAPAVLNLGETCTYLCSISEDGVMAIQSQGEIIGQITGLPKDVPQARKYLYVGKSCWPERDMFKGQVDQLQVWNGQAVDWHEVVDTFFEEDQSGFDRPLLMKELLQARAPAKTEPVVHGADLLSHKEVKEDGSLDSGIDPGYFVSALLRCCYGVVQVPASSKAEAEMVNALLDKHLVARFMSLVRMVGPFNCCCGIKFLQLMSTVLLARSTNPDVEMLVTCYVVMSYASSIVDDAVRALEGTAEQQRLGRLLSEQMAKLCSVVCGSLQYLHFADEDKQFHAKFVECCLDEMVPPQLLHAFVQMALHSDKSSSQIAMVDDVRQLLVKVIERCPARQRETWQDLCATLLNGEVDKGQEWLSDLLEAVERSAAQRVLEEQEAAKAFGTQKITYEDAHPERSLGTYNAEVVALNQRLSVSRQLEKPCFLNFVVTNKAIRIVDTSVVGYPAEDPGQVPDCNWKLGDLVRISRGYLPQTLFISVRRPSEDPEGRDTEGIVVVVFHRPKDRDAALGKLQHLKLLPVDDDQHVQEALEGLGLKEIVHASHAPPQEPVLSRVLEPLDAKMHLFILSRVAIYQIQVDYSLWRPKSDEKLEDQSSSFKISPEIKFIRDATHQNQALEPEVQKEFLKLVGQARPMAAVEKVSFFPDLHPRMEMSFKDAEDLSIAFFDEAMKDRWREDMLEVLQSQDPTGAGWSRHVRGEVTPMHG